MYILNTRVNTKAKNETAYMALQCLFRATSLDDLPELYNILNGDMSIIESHLLLVKYLPRYNEEQLHRLDVRRGLTGYAQTHGMNAVSWEDKFKMMDVWYTCTMTVPLI